MQMINETQCSETLRDFRWAHYMTRSWLTTTQWWALENGYACVVVRGFNDKCVVCLEINGQCHAVEADGLVPALKQMGLN